jgi:hypothetical protein
MRKEETAFLESLPEGEYKQSWARLYADFYRPRVDRPSVPAPDPKVWTPPPGADTPNTHVDPRNHPAENQDYPFDHPYPRFAPRTLSYNQYWELWSQPLVTDPIVESSDPLRIRLELGDFLPPWQSRPYLPLGAGYCYAWRTAAQWVEHLRTGDRITVSAWISKKPWTPGLYDVWFSDVQVVYWMSRTS